MPYAAAPRRSFVRDLRALKGVAEALRGLGYELDHPTVAVWASMVTSWPTVSTDPTTEQREVARKMYAAGHSMRTISSEIGRHQRTIAAWVADLDPPRVGRGHKVPEEALQQAFSLIEQGHTHQQAADAVGCSQAVISRALKAARAAPDQGIAA